MCLKKVAYRSPAASPCARAAGGAPWERRAALQPLPRRRSRAASAELARTAPLAGARWLWCGNAGTSAGSTGLHNVRKRRSARLSLVLCSGELGGRSVVRRCRLPYCVLPSSARCPSPLLWRRFREAAPAHRVGGRQQEQRVSTPLPQKKKNTERVCGSQLPALPLSLCAGFARRPSWSCLLSVCWCCRCCRHSPSSPLAASEENSEKWRLRLLCVSQSLLAGACQGIQCSIGRQSIERARPPRC